MIEATKILGDEDFERIRELKELGIENLSDQEDEEDEESSEGPSMFVSERDIEPYEVRKKRGQEERKELYKNLEFKRNRKKKSGTSLTNMEKKKNTPWMLAKQSNKVRTKVFMKLNNKMRMKEEGRKKFEKKKRKKKFL
jgi:hypothetical protein